MKKLSIENKAKVFLGGLEAHTTLYEGTIDEIDVYEPDDIISAYEAGAKAVIEEIEKCSSYDAFCQARRMGCISDEYFWKLRQISKKIKELRDE